MNLPTLAPLRARVAQWLAAEAPFFWAALAGLDHDPGGAGPSSRRRKSAAGWAAHQARAWLDAADGNMTRQQCLEMARRAIRDALALDPDCSETAELARRAALALKEKLSC
jgi:hypothetical protein